MGDVIDINKKLKENEQPDPEHVFVDDLGVHWYAYTCSYDIDNTQFLFSIFATNFDDAMRRIKALKQTARVDGQIHLEVDE